MKNDLNSMRSANANRNLTRQVVIIIKPGV